MLAVATLWQREIVRFVRQRSRVVGALVQPIVFWVLLGGGLSASFRPPGCSPREPREKRQPWRLPRPMATPS